MTIDEMLDDVLRKEGGYVNHQADKGGPTNRGITQATLSEWRGRQVSAEDVRNLGADEARQIYVARYYTGPGIHRLPAEIQPQVFDIAVNSGPGNAGRILQRALSDLGCDIVVDGGIGPRTVGQAVSAVAQHGAREVNRAIADRRILFYQGIVSRDPSQGVFLAGWLNRARSFLA